ncbi:MAG: hypothetical protein QW199_00030 [Candidatus Pacearchaeota archaeon]
MKTLENLIARLEQELKERYEKIEADLKEYNSLLEIKERYEKIEADLKEYNSLLEKFKESFGKGELTECKSLMKEISKLSQRIEKELEEYEKLGWREYEGRKLFIKDAEFLEKYGLETKMYEIENNFISAISIPKGKEDIYESGDLKKLKNLKEVNISATAITELTADKLPESVEEIIAWDCELKNYNLKGLNNLKKVNMEVTAITELIADKFPESVEEIDVFGCSYLQNYNLKGLKNLKVVNMNETAITELIADKFPENVEEIYARYCKNLENYNLKGLKNLKKLNIAYSGIKKLEPEYLPSNLKWLDASPNQDISKIKKDPRFEKLKIEIW